MTEESPPAGAELRTELIAAIPRLRAFAVSLCGNRDRADDLVQETLAKALHSIHSFTVGTNLLAWLFAILRNVYYSEFRKQRREVEDADGHYTDSMVERAAQDDHMEFLDFRKALQLLPPDQREALILIGASGLSYEDAARICECAVGTMKSRVSRARSRLSELLGETMEKA
jgi:RNA polymerase sigma-70 factor (ECF subfamily)